jgi:hypothetical protein
MDTKPRTIATKFAQLENRIGDEIDQVPHEFGDPFDTENPRSLCNLVPRKVREAILSPELPRHYLQMSEPALLLHLEKHLEARDYRIRLAFWDEYNAAVQEDRIMRIDTVITRVTNMAYFYRVFLQNKYKVILMLQPPASYKITVRELLNFSLNRMREIIALPLMDKKGQPNVHLIREMIKIFALADARVQGAVKQTIDINQRSMNVDMTLEEAKKLKREHRQDPVDALDAEINRLEREVALFPEKSSLQELAVGNGITIPETMDAVYAEINEESRDD